MTLPDADHQPVTPVVHTTRRAALAAERAEAARRAERPEALPPADRQRTTEDRTVHARPATERVVLRATGPGEPPVRAAAPVGPDASSTPTASTGRATVSARGSGAPRPHVDTRARRVPRRRVALTGVASVARDPRRPTRTSRLAVTSAVAALVLFGASAVPAHAGTAAPVATSTLAPAVGTQDFAVTRVALADTARDGFTVGGGVAATDVSAGDTISYGGDVRSPFPGPVRMSSGFGYRAAPCAACSSLHQGLDFNPGMGAPIGAVAAGTVRVSGVYFSYGQTVIIDHVVDGREVSTLYGHLIPGSSPLRVGDVVEPGQFIGSVGSSGVSTGAHLHLEVLMDGTLPVDPAAWLRAQTGRAL